MKSYFVFFLFISVMPVWSQSTGMIGSLRNGAETIAYANLQLEAENFQRGYTTDEAGVFVMEGLAPGHYTLRVSHLGYLPIRKEVDLEPGQVLRLDLVLEEDRLDLEEVVVSATRYALGRQEAPVMVKVLSSRALEASQAMSLSEGLNLQPGVRVETNCQNCGFTQVRMNGLEGPYSQILINSRPVFSALNSVYGLEQIPASIIDRVEVVRSGGSALYGSNAIAGTINIITKEPEINAWEVSSNHALIGGNTPDHTVNANASFVDDALSRGITAFGMLRRRGSYDANGDGFSELTRLKNTTLGGKAFLKPDDRSKVTLDITAIREYRRGGDRLDEQPHLTDITEELEHNTWMGGLAYERESRSGRGRFTAYASAQKTLRDSYYGGLGGGREPADSLAAANAYGDTRDLALVAGLQFSNRMRSENALVFGIEYRHAQVEDRIPGYNRNVDQQVNTLGAYAQFEWKPVDRFTTLLGARYDHTLVQGSYAVEDVLREVDLGTGVLSPRITLMYSITDDLQFRGGYARGFRAPQAFNEDLHISSVGGEPRFVILADDLEKEVSDAFTASLNYSYAYQGAQYNIVVEGFYTLLYNPFTVVSTGSAFPNGSILEEVRNGAGARVGGANIEASYSPSRAFLFQAGGTLQRSLYSETQILYDPAEGNDAEQQVASRRFMRSPDIYGFMAATWNPGTRFGADLSGVYTGAMIVPHVMGPTGYMDLVRTEAFTELNLKLRYHIDLADTLHLELSGGVQNMFNSYQDDFDSGAGRDSDYIYGPFRPRTFFVGMKLGNFH